MVREPGTEDTYMDESEAKKLPEDQRREIIRLELETQATDSVAEELRRLQRIASFLDVADYFDSMMEAAKIGPAQSKAA